MHVKRIQACVILLLICIFALTLPLFHSKVTKGIEGLEIPIGMAPSGLWTDAPYTTPAPLMTELGVHGIRSMSTGTLKALVLMIKFTDVSNDPIHDDVYFNDILFSSSNPMSMRVYYFENSYGQTVVIGDVYPVWLNSLKTLSWYGTDSPTGIDDANGDICELAREALQLADPSIDFSQYDTDFNGVVDHLYIIHAGPDQAHTANTDDIWSHRRSMQPIEVVDGVVVEGYMMLAESDPMGVFAHEFGHDLGLPDLYDRDYSSYGVGLWCLMGYGANLNPPVHLSAWCKYTLGWITPLTVTTPMTGVIINRIEDSSTSSLYKIPVTTGSDVEYFLIENRQKTSFDISLPGSGILIWHIDERQWIIQNNDENHKLVDLEEADGQDDLDLKNNAGDNTDPWSINPSGFTETSYPSSNSTSGALTNIEVTNISVSGSTITVDLTATQGWFQISYDDGDPDGQLAYSWTEGCMFAVRFTPETQGQLKTASFLLIPEVDTRLFKVHILDTDRNDIIPPLSYMVSSIGWVDIDLTAYHITLSPAEDFYIGLEFTTTLDLFLGSDESSPDGRSWDWDGTSWSQWLTGDYLIRAVFTKLIISTFEGMVINAPANDLYFIYPNYQGGKPPGVYSAQLSDWTAKGFLIGMCSNRQYEITDTNSMYVDISNGSIKLQEKTIVLTGGPIVNAPVNYYEKNRIAPVYFQWDQLNNVFYWYTADGTRLDETAMPASTVSNDQDMFVIEAFFDESGNRVFIIYGYGWKGTFAGGLFFKSMIHPDIHTYSSSCYIHRWSDSNGDGFVDIDEIETTPVVKR